MNNLYTELLANTHINDLVELYRQYMKDEKGCRVYTRGEAPSLLMNMTAYNYVTNSTGVNEHTEVKSWQEFLYIFDEFSHQVTREILSCDSSYLSNKQGFVKWFAENNKTALDELAPGVSAIEPFTIKFATIGRRNVLANCYDIAIQSETQKQALIKDKRFLNGKTAEIKITYNDECSNGHNSFHITGIIYEGKKLFENERNLITCGSCHKELAKFFPEYAKLFKWHGFTAHGNTYYIENSQYFAQLAIIAKINNDNLEYEEQLQYARDTALWDDATVSDILDNKKLYDRAPALLLEFKSMVESLGFTF